MLERSRETGKGDRQGDPRTDCKKQQRSWWRVGGASGIQPKSSRKKEKKSGRKGWRDGKEAVKVLTRERDAVRETREIRREGHPGGS